MANEEGISVIIKVVGILLILLGITGTFSGIYALIIVRGYTDAGATTRGASITLLDATLQLTRDKDDIKNSLESVGGDLEGASSKLVSTSEGISETSTFLTAFSEDIDSGADAMAGSAKSDKEASVELIASANALDSISPQAAEKLRAAARKIEDSGKSMEATSTSLKQAALDINAASTHLKESSQELEGVGTTLNGTGEEMRSVASSFDTLTTRITRSMNEGVEGLQILNIEDQKTLLYGLIIYFTIVHLLFAGIGAALLMISANIYGW